MSLPALAMTIDRLQQALQSHEPIVLCTGSLPGGIVVAALLSQGLAKGQIHVYHQSDFDAWKAQGVKLAIVCHVVSHNDPELDYAKSIGLEIINLPNVVIAYQILESLQAPNHSELLDLVAIGILSDWIEITEDVRTLFQLSIPKLQAQADSKTTTRPGIHQLLTYCKNRGDRATDYTSGLGARIRAFGQINPQVCFELLVIQDEIQSKPIADQAELAHIRLLAITRSSITQGESIRIGRGRGDRFIQSSVGVQCIIYCCRSDRATIRSIGILIHHRTARNRARCGLWEF
jgi:hypothetical protein